WGPEGPAGTGSDCARRAAASTLDGANDPANERRALQYAFRRHLICLHAGLHGFEHQANFGIAHGRQNREPAGSDPQRAAIAFGPRHGLDRVIAWVFRLIVTTDSGTVTTWAWRDGQARRISHRP